MESLKAGIVLKENPLYDNFDSASSKLKKEAHSDVMSVMIVDITIEAAMAEMGRKISLLMKVVEEQDHEISFERGNPKQHVAHFVETYENAGSRGDQLVRCEQLEIEFLNRFYSTGCVVSMMELANTKPRKGEPIIDYINRWRALSLDCKDKLTELSVVEMCTQEQAGKVDDPNYCKYHSIISHPVEKRLVLKELSLKLARKNKIELNIDKVAQMNHVAVKDDFKCSAINVVL
ncbi:ty3-gypsy retrotransposon protein [Cucumis melo var. makuwa]|uniref:Ty3-gypsy retrotransposon protein n=1 Tax=Cucumis melo var. makuwa TaxID=1194695 RepID=A0A5D3D6G2_CUCMM|nr:ty3-gypsy retrotransposon protein [Cucumis melo var. makuwa]TYK19125.1 ty3-gypsy retrotransposon protein [Cucumis melo var. makuwa]